ncbi:MAG: hypothetical protein RL508_507 [Actinomycetota bacterium]|jgi:outer membrane protein OmpA-like peptidoglycan-associated protein
MFGNLRHPNLRRISLRIGFTLLAAAVMYLLASSQTSWASSETQERNSSASASPSHEYESPDAEATESDDSGDDGESQEHHTPPPVPPVTPTPSPTDTSTPEPTPTDTPTPAPTDTPPATPDPRNSPTSTPPPLDPVEVPNGTGNSSKGGGVQTTLSANKANTGLHMQGSSWSLDLIGRNRNGVNVELDAAGNIVFRQGHQAYTSGTGFKPNSTVNVYIFSTPILIGTVQTNAEGSFEGSFALPSGLEPGAHTVQVDGYAPDGSVRTANMPVLYATPKPGLAILTVFFTPDSTRLTAAAKASLRLLEASIPADAEDIVSSTKGYVYPFGSRAHNLRISTARANNITAALIASGVKGSFSSAGLGRINVKAKSSRRVELKISYNVYTAFAE